MVRNRRGHDLRVKAIINHGKQLGRSFLMLVHFITVFVCFVSHSVNCFVGVLKWTSMFARYTVALFESIHRSLDWWTTRRRRGAMKKMVSSSDTDSEWRRRLRCYGFKEDVPGKQSVSKQTIGLQKSLQKNDQYPTSIRSVHDISYKTAEHCSRESMNPVILIHYSLVFLVI